MKRNLVALLFERLLYINSIKANCKAKRLFRKFYEAVHADHVKLLLHTEVGWLSKENCIRRFMKLFELFSEILKDKFEMLFQMTPDGKTYASYLADIFEKTLFF